MEKKGVIIICLLIMGILSISFVSADFLSKITGKVPQNLSISVAGLAPANIIYISNPGSPTPIIPNSFSYKSVIFEIWVSDTDGYSDINTSSVWINVSYNGVDRINNSCNYQGNIIDLNTANFTCTVDLWYWDPAKDWNITVKANDKGNLIEQTNNTGIFSYGGMNSIEISPEVLGWPSVSPIGEINVEPTNGPVWINNTGNRNNTIEITAYNFLNCHVLNS